MAQIPQTINHQSLALSLTMNPTLAAFFYVTVKC